MPRPCNHNVKVDGCIVCDRFYMDGPNGDAYRLAWGGEDSGENIPEKNEAGETRHTIYDPPLRQQCFHLDEKIIDRRGSTCLHSWVRGCEIFGSCSTGYSGGEYQCCRFCPSYIKQPKETSFNFSQKIPIVLKMPSAGNCPGDIVSMTNAVHSLHKSHPNKYATFYVGPCRELFDFDVQIRPVEKWHENYLKNAQVIEMDCSLINRSDSVLYHFSEAYARTIENALNVRLRLEFSAPRLFLSSQEKRWISQVQEIVGEKRDYIVINAGYKKCFTAKNWGFDSYQKVVSMLGGAVQFVQIGEANHHHPPLDGVIDLRGKTDTRQLMRLVWNSSGGVGPITFLQHLCAAFEKPYACIAGGREPAHWIQYPLQTTFHTLGALACCKTASCWKSRTESLGDGSNSDSSICVDPVKFGLDTIGRCMTLISPEEVAKCLRQFMENKKTS